MGRNSAKQIFWTHAFGSDEHTISWYCQQHAKWDQITNSLLPSPGAMTQLTNELNNVHGCVNQ